MPRGTVDWYDANLGYGFITVPGVPEKVYVNRRALGDTWSCLIAGEEVEFAVTTNMKGQPQADSVRSLLTNRLEGVVIDWQSKRGVGHIVPANHNGAFAVVPTDELPSGEGVFFHYSDGISDTSRTMKNGERVTYELGQDGNGNPRAVRIKRLDPRYPLYRFAMMGREQEWLEQLVQLAESERWDFHPPRKDKPKPRRVLRNYVIYTFARLEDESTAKPESNKIAYSDDGEWACFNTGLVHPDQEEIFGLFRRSLPNDRNLYGSSWKLQMFCLNSDNRLLQRIKRRPELASYYDSAADLVFAVNAEIVVDNTHVFDAERLSRFPEPYCHDRNAAIGVTYRAKDMAQARLKRNYKTAIPNYYNGAVELLLPLCLSDPSRADLALALTKIDDRTYRAETVHRLGDAYKMARLITRPDTDWLDPFDPAVEPEGPRARECTQRPRSRTRSPTWKLDSPGSEASGAVYAGGVSGCLPGPNPRLGVYFLNSSDRTAARYRYGVRSCRWTAGRLPL